jgi:hypothetical protein
MTYTCARPGAAERPVRGHLLVGQASVSSSTSRSIRARTQGQPDSAGSTTHGASSDPLGVITNVRQVHGDLNTSCPSRHGREAIR